MTNEAESSEPLPFPSDEDLYAAGWIKASRRARLIAATPRVGQTYWIDFPHDAYPPEFVGDHPGVIVRAARQFSDTCIVVPLTSTPQAAAKHTHQLATNPNPVGRSKGVVAYAICDHLYTVHLARLRPMTNKYGGHDYGKVAQADLEAIFGKVREALVHVFPPQPPLQVPPGSEKA